MDIKNRIKNFYKKYHFEIAAGLAIFIWLSYSESQKKFFLDENKFIDWLQFNSNGLLIIIGSFCTILAVVMTLDQKEKDKKNTILKLKLIIKFEVIKYLKVKQKQYLNELYDRTLMINDHLTGNKSLENYNNKYPEFSFSDDFKDNMLKLIVLDNKCIIGEKLLDLYNNQIDIVYCDEISSIESKLFHLDVYFNGIYKFKCYSKNHTDYIIESDEILESISECLDNIDRGVNYYSNDVNNIIEYLSTK